MNALVQLRSGEEVCGIFDHGLGQQICMRPSGHQGSHVVEPLPGTFVLVNTIGVPCSFEIAPSIALLAKQRKDWTWPE